MRGIEMGWELPLCRSVVVGLALVAWAGVSHAQADEARARQIIGGSCFLCHGPDGEAASEGFPRLAAQNAEYIAKQLENFKSGKRKSSAMASMVANLSAEDMAALGRFYASRPAHQEAAENPQLASTGQALYHSGNPQSGVPACASCHGKDAAGSAALPRLAGQHAGYLQAQLKQFNQRERTNDNAVMHAVVEKMTAAEMAAVSQYLSGQ